MSRLPRPRPGFRGLSACLLAASEVYGREVSEAVAGVWWGALKAYDIEAIETAFRRHMTNPDTGQFMPRPADIVRMLNAGFGDLAAASEKARALGAGR